MNDYAYLFRWHSKSQNVHNCCIYYILSDENQNPSFGGMMKRSDDIYINILGDALDHNPHICHGQIQYRLSVLIFIIYLLAIQICDNWDCV